MAFEQIGRENLSRSFSLAQTNVLTRAFALLGASVFAAFVTGYLSLAYFGFSSGVSLVSMILVMVASFVVPRFGDTAVGYLGTVATGGLLGIAIVPTIAAFVLAGKAGIVLNALLSTGVIFAVLATFTITTKRDFTNIGGFLVVAMIAALVIGLLNVFLFKSSVVQVALSYVIALVSCGFIVYRLSFAVRTGLISAVELAFGLLIDLYNLFVSLLQIFNNRD